MQVEIWSDVVCPWCYIGKRHLEDALGRFEHRDDVEVIWRSYQLDPTAPRVREIDQLTHLSEKYGIPREQAQAMQARVVGIAAEAGLTYHLDEARAGNSFDAHRLVHLAAESGLADAMEERLFLAYMTEAQPIGEVDTLRALAIDIGLDAAAIDDVLATDRYADEVVDDIDVARRLGITGVPFFVIDRQFGVSGAQRADVLLGALEEAWATAATAPATLP